MNDFHEGAPREIDRADVLGELLHRFEQDNPNSAIEWVLDTLTELDILRFREQPLCGTPEGMTSIDCQLPKGHVMPDGSLRTVHEGTTTAEQTAYVGYEMFVRWPVDGKTLPGTAAAEAEVREKAVGAAVLREKIRREELKQGVRAPWTGDGSEEPPADVRKVASPKGIVERRDKRWWWTVYDGEVSDEEFAEEGSWDWTPFLVQAGPFREVP